MRTWWPAGDCSPQCIRRTGPGSPPLQRGPGAFPPTVNWSKYDAFDFSLEPVHDVVCFGQCSNAASPPRATSCHHASGRGLKLRRRPGMGLRAAPTGGPIRRHPKLQRSVQAGRPAAVRMLKSGGIPGSGNAYLRGKRPCARLNLRAQISPERPSIELPSLRWPVAGENRSPIVPDVLAGRPNEPSALSRCSTPASIPHS